MFNSPIPPACVLTSTMDFPAFAPTTTAPAARDAPATALAEAAFALALAIDDSVNRLLHHELGPYLKSLYMAKLNSLISLARCSRPGRASSNFWAVEDLKKKH